ncbi:Pentatricopeptide repeat-containing protein chloroplastic [Arabidopsis thaliana]|uniref:Pentatricopeptide repeat-containing protein At1g74600, chloroplastic n=4 Tax=Arabidopsis TaxID=3701 RepID=PP121_ARATH|nr:pentatricopeptide (PPR) repeat-containing protein [Arabidopsis thaliana]Q9CA56.1 RecName: Full=Pentatricopeptide repeat-containing protein At1g74600, chloroplastic; Flags: Precursor [Arabidopsis thaliana]KAG7651701.1 Pentatricopeptide repeat [Arabidopsis thaliana x Arabidopsis arenosa]AAG52351.1 hypothetical protein; 84160-81473 [Arabidopsis thaliana]AEE35614.1 pentatricopeptide (PPR) repeat-containing protein [Arabidopsis thaliana]OAP11852.1 OTP87 [Arabidopsis thaliana]|eukprot:NP_177599.1 pentatricopeptide (PPR) repeat-containing protein [Arabidopsis thaliana]
MNCLANESLNSLKISPFSTSRLLSSVTNFRNQLSFSSKDSSSSSAPFNPFRFFNDQSNSRLCNLRTTKILQAHLLRRYLLPFDVFLTKSLLSWYSNSGSMADAAKLFDTIPQPDVVSCNIMISGYKQHRLFEESLRFFSKMHFLGFEANEISYGSVISACSALQAPLFSELVCCHTIKMGYFFYEVVESALIDVFSKNLRFEDAYKVFRDSLSANVYCWNTIIAGALRNQNYGAVFDLFHEMCVGFQKPDSYTYSSVLAACASLEKLRFGKVVQARVIKCGAEDVFVCTAIVDLYAKCGHMAEAMEVFSRIPNPSVVSWTVMLSGYTKSNDAFSALEIFKEMRHSGVEINNCTVTSVISACGRPSMVCEASQVHAWVFKSGFYLDSSVAAALISMYSKSGDIDLSEQVFEDLDDIQRQNIVNVMITSFSQSKKPGKAIRLFTRMLQEGLRTDEFSVCSLLSVLDCLNLGKQVHGYTLKSGLVLDLTVGSSLFTLYSKCGSLEESYKLFQGIPFKDNACWASMISGFNEYGYLREAIGLFSEMLDDGTSPDESTLAAVLTVCSSHPSLPRGKEIHGYTLRAGIDKGMDLGSALVNMYSKCGSLKLARQVYDRLPELDPVSCSSLISGYSQHGLIQDGFLLFRDMVMSGFTMDSFAISSILKAAALSDESSLGAQVHAYITKIGLCTEPSVGSSLLTMYSKFGSIDDCCKAFSQINGPDLIAWTALIASYAQHGKANEALQVYNLMKEKGFKPDKVTFVGVLSACSHGGLVEESYFHLNSMVKDYGIEPENRHYVCMVDALGRSGRLREAESFINNMHIKPDALVWGTLLAACKIHGEVELGKVAAKKAIELEPSDAGAYISLSNILAEVGEWDEVEETRKLMKGTGVQKEPGWSSV